MKTSTAGSRRYVLTLRVHRRLPSVSAGARPGSLIRTTSPAGDHVTGRDCSPDLYLGCRPCYQPHPQGSAGSAGVSEEQGNRRSQTLGQLMEANRKLETTLAENAGLHKQLLAQARDAGIQDERQQLAREIHDTLVQGLVLMYVPD